MRALHTLFTHACGTLLRHFSHTVCVQRYCPEKEYSDELKFVSPFMATFAQIRGYDGVMLVLATVALMGECGFYIVHMSRTGGGDVTSVTACLSAALMMLINFFHCKKVAFTSSHIYASQRTSQKELADAGMSGINYLRCRGFEVMGIAQEKMGKEKGVILKEGDGLRSFRDKLVKGCVIEAVTVHLLLGVLPMMYSATISFVRNYHRGENLMAALAFCSIWGKCVTTMCSAHTSFTIRLAQKMSEFEIRR